MSKTEIEKVTISLILSLKKGFYTAIHVKIDHTMFRVKVIILIDTRSYSYIPFVENNSKIGFFYNIILDSICDNIVKKMKDGTLELGTFN